MNRSRAERNAVLAARGLQSWASGMTPEKVLALQRPAHVRVEGEYRKGPSGEANFDGLVLDAGELAANLHDGARYCVEAALTPALPPGETAQDQSGPRLDPFVIEALTHGATAEHPGLRVRAFRSLGTFGDPLEAREARMEVLTGRKDDVVYVAAIRAVCRPREISYVHWPCRRAWQRLFPENGSPSPFWLLESVNPEPPSALAPLASDPAEAILAIREHLLHEIHKTVNQLLIDGAIMAFSRGTVHCLRMGIHRVMRRTGTTMDTLLLEHTMHRHVLATGELPPQMNATGEPLSIADIPDWLLQMSLSALQPGPPPCAVQVAPSGAGDRWLILSGRLLGEVAGQVSDEAIADALGQGSPDDMAAWLGATASGYPREHAPEEFPDWGLVVVDLLPGAP